MGKEHCCHESPPEGAFELVRISQAGSAKKTDARAGEEAERVAEMNPGGFPGSDRPGGEVRGARSVP